MQSFLEESFRGHLSNLKFFAALLTSRTQATQIRRMIQSCFKLLQR